jgi:glutathione synthase/RimK-type ligase-like ATP-grasp enzyme
MQFKLRRSKSAAVHSVSKKRNVVLILANPNDIHARSVAAEVGVTFDGLPVILDTRAYPSRWHLTATVNDSSAPNWRLHSGPFTARSDQVCGVWRRRTALHRIHSDVEDRGARRFCLNDATAAFQGWLHGMGSSVINPPGAEYAANRKLFQLQEAKTVGLRIPDTIVTSDLQEARLFLNRLNGQTVFKVLAGARQIFVETRRFRKRDLRELGSLRYAPVIFQELIEAELDIRVTIVDEEVFPVAIKPRNPKARLDWRLDPTVQIEPHTLPIKLERELIVLLRALGLRFGAVDMRLTPHGKYVFLEINPAGQFLFCEIHGKQPISRAIAAALLGVKSS